MARNITNPTPNLTPGVGKYIGFNLDAFGIDDEYFSTTGDYQTKRSSAGVQGLSASSFKREGGISLIEMFDVGILGMPTITALIDKEEAPSKNQDNIAYRINHNIVQYTEKSAYSFGDITAYSISSYFDSDHLEYVGVQSIADVFSIFSQNFDYIAYSLKDTSSTLNTRVTTLENTLGLIGTDTDDVINRYNEIKSWFSGVEETESGATLITTVGNINANYIKSISSGTNAPSIPVTNNHAEIFASNISLPVHSDYDWEENPYNLPAPWPAGTSARTNTDLYEEIYRVVTEFDSQNPAQLVNISYSLDRVSLYGYTIDKAFEDILSTMSDHSQSNYLAMNSLLGKIDSNYTTLSQSISTNYNTLSQAISTSYTNAVGYCIHSVNGKTGSAVTIDTNEINLSNDNTLNSSFTTDLSVYDTTGYQIVYESGPNSTLAYRIRDIAYSINTIAETDYKRDEWLILS